MNEVSDAWIMNERTAGDWVLIEFRIGNQLRTGILTDPALAAIFLAAGNGAHESVIKRLLVRAIHNFLNQNPHVVSPIIGCPVDLT